MSPVTIIVQLLLVIQVLIIANKDLKKERNKQPNYNSLQYFTLILDT